jgi:hypothetical protein
MRWAVLVKEGELSVINRRSSPSFIVVALTNGIN